MRGDGGGVDEPRHAHALVALLHVEALAVLEHANGLVEALFRLRSCKGAPLCGELGIRLQKRHEPAREAVLAAVRARAGDEVERDVERAHVSHAGRILAGEDVVERGRIRVATLGNVVPHLALALFTGADIRFEHSERPPWKALHFE